MKVRTYTLPQRLIAMVLTLVLLLPFLPALDLGVSAAGLQTGSVVADANTMDEWKNAFLPGGLPSTDYAGAIWTDKTVLTSAGLSQSSLNGKVNLSNANNFMVALSALATNSVVVGQGSVPTDTVFVLDISGSMNDTALTGMVNATNNAIRMLMTENSANRVGVVLYAAGAETLLPLDHYEGATSNRITTPTYLTYLSGENIITSGIGTTSWSLFGGTTINIAGPTNSSGKEVEKRITCGGGTYIQGGVWDALENHFGAVEDAKNRVPAVILMSDGAPTYVSSSFDNVGSSTNGAGDESYNGDGFVTQLTLSYLREKLKTQYGKALIYTVGFGLESIQNETQKAIANKVLNPDMAHAGIDNLWKTYQALGANGTMNVQLGRKNGNTETTTVTIKKSSTTLSPNYVDIYFKAEDAASLNTAFQNIVNDISLQAGYYPTRTDDNGTNYSGYITFTDTLGAGMEVKQIEGIMIGGTLYDGHKMAQILHYTDVNTKYLAAGGNAETLPHEEWLGTVEHPTALGDEFVRAVKARMGITAATTDAANAIAWELIGNAWTTGQLSYDPDTGAFNNYIAWYGDANGKYVAPYTEGQAAPAGAAYINFCYGMLGASSTFGLESDLMYVTVQVSQSIATGETIVTFRIPAAMLPTLTYQVNVQIENGDVVPGSATISAGNASPIVLVYEVGVDEELVNPLTVQNYGTLITEGPDAGKYYLYASAWSKEENKEILKNALNNHMAYAYFEPGPENEHYYFPQDTALYNADGSPYTGTNPAADAVYFYDTVYTAQSGTGTTAEGKTTYQAQVHAELVKLAAQDLAFAVQKDGTWYMPEGTMYANTYNYDLTKNGDHQTNTHNYVHYHIVDGAVKGDLTYHYEIMYQGNNGRLVYAPAQGFSLTKELTPEATSLEQESFLFTVAITGDSDNSVLLTYADGTSETKALVSGKLTVTLKAGQTVQITELDTGASYTVTEAQSDLYQVTGITINGISATAASGQVLANTVTDVVFTNDEIHYGAFNVTKLVSYNNGTAAVEGKLASFPVEITLAGYAGKTVKVDGEDVSTNEFGKFTVNIQDGQTIQISNVPQGTAYTVTELTDDPDPGYAVVAGSGSGTVSAAITGVTLRNSYTPTHIVPDPEFVITGTKTVVNAANEPVEWHGNSFTIRLQRWNPALLNGQGDWEEIPNGNLPETKAVVTQDSPTYRLTLTQAYSQVGEYTYRIIEDKGDVAGVTYDENRNLFMVQITDKDLNGALEMTVVNVKDTTVTAPAAAGEPWKVSTDFKNRYDLTAATWTPAAVKQLTGWTLRADMFRFQLEAVTAGAPMPEGAVNGIATMANGQGGHIKFPAIIYTQNMVGQTYRYKLTEIAGNAKGFTYDTTEYYISVAVTQSGTAVLATPTVTKDQSTDPITTGMVFTNSYKAESVAAGPFDAAKTLYNRTPGAAGQMAMTDGQFSFRLSANDAAYPMPAGAANGVLILTNTADGKITIPAITYTAAGVYTYTLTEIAGNAKGYTYDDTAYTITVTVADDGSGQLKVASTVFSLADGTIVNEMTFANEYKAAAAVPVTLGGTKEFLVADKNLTMKMADGDFAFLLSNAAGLVERVTNVGNSFTFKALPFDRVGTYTYTITEERGLMGGVVYDQAIYTVTVTVSDKGEGQLETAVAYQKDAAGVAAVVFTNRYDVQNATLPITATKSMTGRQPLHGEFQFTLEALENAPMPELAENGKYTVANGYRGLVDFGSITYAKAGTYQYKVFEVEGNLGGVTYDKTVYTVTVTVSDNENGALEAAITKIQGNDYNDLIFRNAYQASGVTVDTISGTKTLTNKTPGAEGPMTMTDGQFSFRLSANDITYPMPAGSTDGVLTVTNQANGTIAIPAITYKVAGVYTYTLTEVAGNAKGYTYDNKTYTITVTVTDDGSGVLKSDVAYSIGQESAPALAFANEYRADASNAVAITGTKILAGRPLADGEFRFTLTGPQVENGQTVTNVGNTFTFDQLTFTSAGQFVYTVKEENNNVGGVSYDETVYTVTVSVTFTNGQLNAAITKVEGGDNQSVIFNNSYKAGSVTVDTMAGNKVLNNKTPGAEGIMTLTDGQFSFLLKANDVQYPMPATAANGELLLTNKADGTIAIPGITFAEEGVFTYTLTEVEGNAVGYSYDDTVYTITVTISDDGSGVLQSDVAYSIGQSTATALTFTNEFQVPPPPQTVDGSNITAWVLLAGVSAMCMMAVLVLGKKQQEV